MSEVATPLRPGSSGQLLVPPPHYCRPEALVSWETAGTLGGSGTWGGNHSPEPGKAMKSERSMVLRFPEPRGLLSGLRLPLPHLAQPTSTPTARAGHLGPPATRASAPHPLPHTPQNSSCTQERLSFQTLVSTSGSGVNSDRAPLLPSNRNQWL